MTPDYTPAERRAYATGRADAARDYQRTLSAAIEKIQKEAARAERERITANVEEALRHHPWSGVIHVHEVREALQVGDE